MKAIENNFGEKALLAKFGQKKWSANKEDKSAGKELRLQKNASSNADVRVIKKIIDDSAFDRLGMLVSAAYRFHQEMTIPWLYRGVGLLPIALHSKYTTQMRKFKAELETAKIELMKVLPSIIKSEKTSGRLGDLFNEADYPMANLADYFDFAIQFFPVPQSGHFMVDMQNEAIEDVKKAFAEAEKEAIKESTSDLWKRIYKVVDTMSEQLNNPKGKIYDSLVENITNLCGLLPALNINNDPELTNMTRVIEDKLGNIGTEDLRTDKKVRKETATSAKEILTTLQEMGIKPV